MKGLELAERYYYDVGRPAIEAAFPELLPMLAAGLAGEGSECFGYDDEISRDHDFGPGFCVWLPIEILDGYGERLERLYDSLPKEYAGFPARAQSRQGSGRTGFMSIGAFYARFLGGMQPPRSDSEWMAMREEDLASAVNGKVFEDNLGEFTRIREAVAAYYPEKVYLRRLAGCLHRLSQSGQYNYARSMRRGDTMAARMAEDVFIRETLQLAHLLEHRYMPYYKWAWRSFTELEISAKLEAPLRELTGAPVQTAAWNETADPYINRADVKVRLIEEICAVLLEELEKRGLAEGRETFLDAHVDGIMARIRR